jgi:hypothetical protein
MFFFGSFGARGYLGDSSTRIREKGIEENDIPIIPDKLGYFCITKHSHYTRRYSSDKHVIQISRIGSLLSLIGKQNHKIRSLRGQGANNTSSQTGSYCGQPWTYDPER